MILCLKSPWDEPKKLTVSYIYVEGTNIHESQLFFIVTRIASLGMMVSKLSKHG